ncbi:hypothetical protein IscW_ISCW013466, partial [Ixodes scapularis]
QHLSAVAQLSFFLFFFSFFSSVGLGSDYPLKRVWVLRDGPSPLISLRGKDCRSIDIDFSQVSSSRPCLRKHAARRLRRGPCSGGCLPISTGNSLFCVCVAHSRIWGNRVKWRGAHPDLDLPPSICRRRSRSQEAKSRRYQRKREKRHFTKVGRAHDLSGGHQRDRR